MTMPMPEPAPVTIDQERLADLCRQCHVQRLWVFGSLARNEARPDSDADFLVEFDEQYADQAFTWFFDLWEGLAHLVGRKVDLLRRAAIRNQRLMKHIDREKREVYAA